MPLPPLPDSAIALAVDAADWRAAVRAAGAALAASGSTTAAYADRMVDVIEEYGAYVVVAPGLALAHARPGPEVLAEGISVVTLAHPVAFGHAHNDPVQVVVGLAVRNAEAHVASVAELANVFNDEGVVAAIARATEPDEIRALLGAPEGGEVR